MSWNSGTQGTGQANALYTTITSYMTGWSFVETVSAADAGTTADCKVWRAPNDDWYLIFEPDNTNNRIRVYASKQYTPAPTYRVKRYIPATASNTAYTPKADYSYDNTNQTIGTGAYAQLTVSGTGFNWWVGVGPGNGSVSDLIYVGSDAGSYPSAFMAGFFTPTVGVDFPLFLWASGNNAANAKWPNAGGIGGTVRFSHEYGLTASETGAFCGTIGFLPLSSSQDAFGSLYTSYRNRYITDGIYVFDALIHGVTSGGIRQGLRGYLPGFKVAAVDSGGSVRIGDTVTAGGITYFVAGVASTGAHSNLVMALLIDTSAAF